MKVFTQLSYNDRRKIYRGICERRTQKEIAIMLGRSASTVSREVKRNSDEYGYCYPNDAHQKAKDRHNKNIPKIIKNKELKSYIIGKLKDRWSPETIARSWSTHNKMTISKEAIYQWIYTDHGKTLGLIKLLVRSRKKRGLQRKIRSTKIKNRVSIHRRPQFINVRREPGHYECDLMFNSGSQSKNICTFIERVTRKAFLIKNNDKSSKTVIDSLIGCIITNNLKVSSITFDNGSEFADHHRLNKMGIATYFCDPGVPSQKGSIENLNGVIRRYLPFEFPAEDITDEYVSMIEGLLDIMPRKILADKTPLEVFKQCFYQNKNKESRVKPAAPAEEASSFYQKNNSVAFHP